MSDQRNNDFNFKNKEMDQSSTSPKVEQVANVNNSVFNLYDNLAITDLAPLSSKGKFYPTDHPLHNKETVEIKKMTTKEENILTSEAFIKNNEVLDRLFRSIIVDKRINPESLLSVDRKSILIYMKIYSYGENLKTTVNCPSCNEKQTININLIESLSNAVDQELLTEIMNKNKVKHVEGNLFEGISPTGLKIQFKLLTGKDELEIVKSQKQLRNKYRKIKQSQNMFPENNVTEMLSHILVSINGITDKSILKQAINQLIAKDTSYIREVYKLVEPDAGNNFNFVCNSCDYESYMEVPIDQNFFRFTV